MIQGLGSTNPRVFLVGDYAQGEDVSSNYALQGYKASMLQKFCKTAGVQWNDLYRTLLIKGPVPHVENLKRKTKGKEKKTEVEYGKVLNSLLTPEFAPVLLDEIRTLKPNLLVPLGETSFQFLTGLEGIRKFRGSILRLNPLLGIDKYTKVLPTLGPYPYLFSEPKQEFITQVDFSKIPKWQDEKEVPDDTYRIWIARSSTALRNYLERAYLICISKTVEEGGYGVFDIESFMNIPTCMSICMDGFESVCIPFLDTNIEMDQRVLMIDLVAKWLNSPLPKVNQNVKYDWKTQERWRFKVSNIVGDTMLAASTLYCEFPKNLGFLTSIYTDLPYFKDEGRQYDPSKHKKEQFYLYNAKDSLSTHQIYSQQLAETKQLGTNFVYESLVKLIPIYRRMEDRGMRVDEQQRDKLYAKYSSLFRVHCNMLRRLTNLEELNPLSSVQIQKLVFEELGYNRKQRGVKGADEESLNMLMCFGQPEKCTIETGKQILQEIIFCRKIHKVIEILELDIYPDGRYRCEFNLAGTETGRTSAGQTTDYFLKGSTFELGKKQKVKTTNLGHSFQTIGKHGFFIEGVHYGTDVRSMYVPSHSYSFVEIDLSGAEARVDRVLSGNFDMSVFDNPGIHKLTGSWLFSCRPDQIKKGTLEYHLAKTFRHAGERNMGPNRAFMMCQDEGTGLSLTLKDCKTKLEIFHNNEPDIQRVYHRDIKACIEANRCLVAPNGRRRDFFDRIDHHTINEGISQLPQSIVSDQTKFSFIPTFKECDWAYLVVEAHDGAMAEVPKGREEEYAVVYKRNVERSINFRFGSLKRDYDLVIPAEVSIGENWEELETVRV